MLVKEYALQMLQWQIRKDPWVREIFLASGVQLDRLAERIIDIYNAENFDRMSVQRLAYYEKLLGLIAGDASVEDRRRAVIAGWNVSSKPSLAAIQSICDSWPEGGITLEWSCPTLTLHFDGEYGIPANIESLKQSINDIVPAHVEVIYDYNTLLIEDIDEMMTIEEMELTDIEELAGGA